MVFTSPDLNPVIDFFLWGHLESVIYFRQPLNLDKLQQLQNNWGRRINSWGDFVRILANVIQEFVLRFMHIFEKSE